MTHYLVQHRDRIFVKSYGFLSFARNMRKNVGKNISKNLSGKKILGHTKQSVTVASKKQFKKQQKQLMN